VPVLRGGSQVRFRGKAGKELFHKKCNSYQQIFNIDLTELQLNRKHKKTASLGQLPPLHTIAIMNIFYLENIHSDITYP